MFLSINGLSLKARMIIPFDRTIDHYLDRCLLINASTHTDEVLQKRTPKKVPRISFSISFSGSFSASLAGSRIQFGAPADTDPASLGAFFLVSFFFAVFHRAVSNVRIIRCRYHRAWYKEIKAHRPAFIVSSEKKCPARLLSLTLNWALSRE